MADPSFDTYSFDPDAGREGAYTFMRADGTARTVANTPYAASLAADIDARKARPAVGLTGPLPMPDPMAGMVRAQQVEAARVAPEFRPAYDALSGSAPLPDLDAFAAKMQALDAPRPAAPRDAGASLAPEAAQAARAIGTRPPPIDMDALTARLGAIGQPAASQAAPAPMAMAMPEDVMAAETGYRRQGPFDMRRFAVDGPSAPPSPLPQFAARVESGPGTSTVNRQLDVLPGADAVRAALSAPAPPVQATPAQVEAGAVPTAAVSTQPLRAGLTLAPGAAAAQLPAAAIAAMGTTASPAAVAQAAQQSAPAAAPASVLKSLAEVRVEGALPPSARPVGQTANPPQSAGQRIDAQIDKMMAPQFALAQRQGDLSAQAASGEADFAQERAAIGLQRDESDAGRRTTQAGVEQRALADITRAADEVTAKQYDPDRYFKQRGTGAVVLASLAVAMGELGRGLQRTGGPNTALQIVNDAVERDLAAQREEYARAKDKLSLKQNAYAQLRQRGLDDEAASAQARAGALSAVASRAEAFKAGMKTDQAKLDADVTTQKLRDQADGMKAQARAQMAAQASAQANAEAAQRSKQRKEELANAKTEAEINKLNAEAGKASTEAKGFTVPDGYGGTVAIADAPTGRDLQKKAALTLDTLRQLNILEQTTGPAAALDPAKRTARASALSFFGKNREALSDQGVFRTDDRDLYENHIVPGNLNPAAKKAFADLKRNIVYNYRDRVGTVTGAVKAGEFATTLPESAKPVGQ